MKFLTFLAKEVYTCKYGTFLLNCEYEREINKLRSKSVSIWTHVNNNFKDFTNNLFDPLRTTDINLDPRDDYVSIRLWKEHFFEWLPNKNIFSMKEAPERHL